MNYPNKRPYDQDEEDDVQPEKRQKLEFRPDFEYLTAIGMPIADCFIINPYTVNWVDLMNYVAAVPEYRGIILQTFVYKFRNHEYQFRSQAEDQDLPITIVHNTIRVGGFDMCVRVLNTFGPYIQNIQIYYARFTEIQSRELNETIGRATAVNLKSVVFTAFRDAMWPELSQFQFLNVHSVQFIGCYFELAASVLPQMFPNTRTLILSNVHIFHEVRLNFEHLQRFTIEEIGDEGLVHVVADVDFLFELWQNSSQTLTQIRINLPFDEGIPFYELLETLGDLPRLKVLIVEIPKLRYEIVNDDGFERFMANYQQLVWFNALAYTFTAEQVVLFLRRMPQLKFFLCGGYYLGGQHEFNSEIITAALLNSELPQWDVYVGLNIMIGDYIEFRRQLGVIPLEM